MAIFPSLVKKQPYVEVEESYVLPEPYTLPGHTVDALLAEGNLDGARAEFERLIQEGIDSGSGVVINDHFWERLHARAQKRALERR